MNKQIQFFECGYPTVAKDAALSSPSTNKQLVVHNASVYNSTSSSVDCGIGLRYQTASWKLYQLNASTTDLTSTIQAGTASTILPTTNNYGFLVQCKDIFGLISLTISQAETGSPTYSYQYWNGSTWATLTLRNSFVYTAAASIGIAFAPPVDWAKGCGSLVDDFSSLNAGYCIRVRGTTAPSTAVQVTAMAVSKFWAYRSLVGKGMLLMNFEDTPVVLEVGESVQPFFATAAANNTVEINYQVNG